MLARLRCRLALAVDVLLMSSTSVGMRNCFASVARFHLERPRRNTSLRVVTMVSRRKKLWALTTLSVLASSAVVPGARAQVKFSQMTGPEYITYCASAATGQILTPHCSNSYQQLVDVAQAVVSNPQAFGAHHLQQLNDLCAPGPSSGPSCVTQLQNMADGYVEGLPPPSPQVARKDTCEGTLAPNAKSLFDTILPFTCLSDGHGGSCLVEVAQALDKAGACVAGASAVRARGNSRRVGGNILSALGLPFHNPLRARSTTSRASVCAQPLVRV